MFSSSIYNIILFDENISEGDVVKALSKEIGIHDFILTFARGYDYIVGERGLLFQQNKECNLLSFLRVYLRNPQILILDEKHIIYRFLY